MAKKPKSKMCWNYCCNSAFVGWFLLVIGLYFLAAELGYISYNLVFWPLVLIVVGIYLLFNNYKK